MRTRALAFTLVISALSSLPRAALARDAKVGEDETHDGTEPSELDLEQEAFGTHGLVRTRAESVSFDAKERSIELYGDVRIDAAPFHLRSDRIRLARTKWGIEADGRGRLAFCPCLGTPLTIEFEKAIVAPPGELFLKSPKLEVYGVPVMYLPWFWMRGSEKVGLLPPDVAYRGQDGLFLGGGVHLPWRERGGASEALDLRAGTYVPGNVGPGVVVDVRLRTPLGHTKVRWDRLVGANAPVLDVPGSSRDRRADDGLVVDSRGASTSELATVAWDADVLRGRRGVVATTDLDTAAKPWDRAVASAALRSSAIAVESGMRAVTRRGGDLTAVEAVGPFAALRSSGAALDAIAWDATVEGGALRVAGAAADPTASTGPAAPTASTAASTGAAASTPDTVSYARAELGALVAKTLGPIAASLSARGAGDVVAENARTGSDRTASARLRFGVPFARAFTPPDHDPHDRNDPVLHVIEPFAEAAVLDARGAALLGTRPGRGGAVVRGTAPITDAGISSSLGRWATRDALTVSASGGVAYGARPTALVRARAAATSTYAGIDAESGLTTDGSAVVGRARVGRADGVRFVANVATRTGLDPVLARALTDAPLEPAAGFLARRGTTGGATAVIPWMHALTTSIGADADATTRELVAVRGGFDLRDRCGCVTLHANGSHRVGRDGVDVWITLDFAAP
ncbi:MAG: hypothetical protein KIT84_24915 [Labilithrix sp.]|nr:hypothetical protein [Labilithrix sp.]MCW5814292.1 hypothetical protein [Labilithrix sp.]